MASLLRRLLTATHPEGIPGPCAILYETISRSSIFQRHYELVARDIAGYCRSGRLLDVGTGPGWLLLKIHQQAPDLQVTGLDISPAMVRRARRNLTLAGLGGTLEVVEAPAAQVPFPDGSFDVVVSTGSFHHWKDPIGSLNECCRVLKDGGVTLIYDLVTHLPPVVAEPGERHFGRYRMWLLRLHSFEEPFRTPQEMVELASQSRFGGGETKFVSVLCCLVLRKRPPT